MPDLVLAVWRRRKWLAILVFAAVFLPALTVARSLPDIYRATATLLVERSQVAEAFGRSAVTGEEIETRLQTITQEILSSTRLAALIRQLNLYADGQTSLGRAIWQMRQDIKVEILAQVKAVDRPWEAPGATVTFAVSYRGRDPETVARVANALASTHVELSAKMHEQRAGGAAEFAGLLHLQLADAMKRLDEQERRIGEFKRRYGSELAEHMPVNLARLERLNTELRLNSESQARARQRRAALARELAGEESDPREITPAARLAKLRQELRELRTRFTDKYPDVERVQREIAELEMVLAEGWPAPDAAEGADPAVVGARETLRELDAMLTTLRAEEERLRRQITVYQSRVDNTPRREQELQELSRNYEATKELYHSLLKRNEEAQLTRTMELRKGERFRILDPAGTPTQPAGPDRIRLVLFGTLLALAAAAVVTVVAEQSQAVFHTTDELRAFTKVPVLARIPLIVTRADRRRRRLRFGLLALAALFGLALAVAASHYVADGNVQVVRMLMRDKKS